MAKSLQQILAHAEQQRADAAAKNAGVKPAASAPADPAAEGTGLADPKATAPAEAFTLQEDGTVTVDAALVKDGALTLQVAEGGKLQLAGKDVNIGAVEVEQSDDVLALAAQIGTLTVANSQHTAEIADLEAQVAAMAGIVTASLSKMSVALGGAAVDVSKMTVGELVSQHEFKAAQFAAKFPTGAVAAVSETHEDTPVADAAKVAEADAFTRRARLFK